MKTIKLTKEKVTLVDDEDYEWLNQWNWYAQRGGKYYYAARRDRNNKFLLMHRIILKISSDMETDHINHNTLDNQKNNIRICTRSQNNRNHLPKNKYIGVRLYKGKYIQARIGNIYLGTFKTEEEAAKIRDIAAKKYFGEFAYLNFNDNEKCISRQDY